MSTYHETLQDVFHRFEHALSRPGTPREVVEWGLRTGVLELPRLDPVAALTHDMSKALREEYRTDAAGRRYRANHAVSSTSAGQQIWLWGDMETAPRDFMEKAFATRRRGIVSDCIQLRTDVDAYNAARRSARPIQTVLDFTQDVEEQMAMIGLRS